MRIQTLFMGIGLACSCALQSQVPVSFSPLHVDALKEKNTLAAISSRYEKDIAGLDGKNKKYIADIYKERYDLIKGRFTEKEAVTDAPADSYLQSLGEVIFKNNPAISSKDIRLLFSRSSVPNASSMGEGTIFFNIGLFHRLQNEGQAIFVICHELSHYLLNHGNNSIHRYVNTLYSDEFQKQLKAIQKSGYQQNKQLEDLAKGLTFRNRHHSRESEQSADSLAIELMKNTGYDLRESLSCLAILDSVDKDKYESKLLLEQRFNFPDYPFKKSWVEKESVLFTPTEAHKKEKEKDKDSLRTHPDCKIRIKRLEEKVTALNKAGNKPFLINQAKFNELKDQFDFEILEFCFESNQVSLCLYYALEMLNYFPDNSYLHGMIGKCLNEFYARQKKHELGKIASTPDPEYDESYNELLRMIQSWRLSEIISVSYYYHLSDASKYADNEEFVASLIRSKENFDRPGERLDWVDFYRKKFPDGKYKF